MKMGKIMLITFLLLAVVMLGAVSAADDAAPAGLNATHDADMEIEGSDYDEDYHEINVNDKEIDLDTESEEIASITLPDTAKGSFQILNGEDVVASLKVNINDNDHWVYDDDLYGTIYLKDLDLTKIKNGSMLSFKFLENKNGNYNVVDMFTKMAKVEMDSNTMTLTEIEEDPTNDADIHISNIDTDKPDENFTIINVTQKYRIFKITDDEDYLIFEENLNTTKRQYCEVYDENGVKHYIFGFSLNDINTYLARKGETFTDIISNSESDLNFGIYEEDGETDINYVTMSVTVKNGKILFKDESQEEDVEVDCINTEIQMKEGWQETEVIECTVKKGINGRIVIYINGTPAFEKTLSQLNGTDSDYDDEYISYTITARELNMTKAGEYIIRYYVYDENGALLCECDEDDLDIVMIYEVETVTVDNITISVTHAPLSIRSNDAIIEINMSGSADSNDEVIIYADESKDPIRILISECEQSGENTYIITPKQLKLGAGQHDLNITCKNTTSLSIINLTSNIGIELRENNETVYTTFNEYFVSIDPDEDEISDIGGMINLTLTDSEGNVLSVEIDIDAILSNYADDYYVIRTSDVGENLTGNYTVNVRYIDEYGGVTQTEGKVFFKSFEPEDYGISIKETFDDKNDYAITFTSLSQNQKIIIEINGNETEIYSSDIPFDEDKNVYYIKANRLNGLGDGVHSLRMYIDMGTSIINLTSRSFLVDFEENTDPKLTISVANIEKGNVATAVITTDSAYSGEVTVEVANTKYTVNITQGKGSLQIPGLGENTYTATVSLKSDGIFNDSFNTTTFKVTSKPVTPVKKPDVIRLTLKKVKVKRSAKKLVLTATLKINGKSVKGKTVTFKFNGKTYRIKTDRKGIAKLTIKKKVLKKLKVGKKVKY